MARFTILGVALAVAILLVVAVFYVTGAALGVAAVGLAVLAVLGALVYVSIKWRRPSR